jgi:thiamine pyrophosphate-dependent acetolactate synthase large subunit-like protein
VNFLRQERAMAGNVADLVAQTLAAAGVERIWGVTGDKPQRLQ